MKKFTVVLVLVFVALFATGVIAANENGVFLPLVYRGPALAPPTETPVFTETPTSTPEDVDPTASLPTETPTPTPKYIDGYNWVIVGWAKNMDDVLVIYGGKPGYCYDILYTKVEKTIYLEAAKIPVNECDRDGYNPEADWPPPEYPPPTALPPEFGDYYAYKLELGINAKEVCSVFWPENCNDVP